MLLDMRRERKYGEEQKKMKKFLILLAMTMTATACSMDSKPVTSKNAKHICIDEITYIAFREYSGNQGFGYMSVKLDKDSKVILCEVEVE